DATGIGSFITLGNVTGTGSAEMEQYLTGSGGSTPNGLFYYVGSPVAGADASSFNLSAGNKLWSANEATQSYPQITNESTILNPMQGYVARMGSTGVISFEGSSFNSGTQTISGLTRTGTTAANRGYNLVSNPYPSTVEWSTASRTNLETTMWMRTHQGATMLYDTYNATSGIGTNNNGNGELTGDIPPTQAFWVRVANDGQTGALAFDNNDRSHAGWSSIYKTEAEEGTVRMMISNGQNSDETIILFNPDAQDGYDDYDSQKFWAPLSVPQLYTTVGTDTLVINGLTSTLTNPVVDLGMKVPSAGEYTIEATNITVVGESVHLEDRALNIFQDLNAEPNYAFTSDGGNHPNRFALHFGISITDVERIQETTSRVYSHASQLTVQLPEKTTAMLSLLDIAGREVYSTSLRETSSVLEPNVTTGVYIVNIITHKGMESHKVILH
ncbi:MAG: T9SS type A sorting domain-containing protein, partial [Bacteroidetes bacterium]